MSNDEVIVPGWPAPKGYSNGRIGAGRVLHVGGQIGWNAEGKFPAVDDFAIGNDDLPFGQRGRPEALEQGRVDANFGAQFAQTLDNVLAVVSAAGGRAQDIAEMTVFVVDMLAYRRSRKELAAIWRERMGKHYPAMALVSVPRLFEPDAMVEIQAVAYLGDPP